MVCRILLYETAKGGFMGKGESRGLIKPQIGTDFIDNTERYVMANRETVNVYTIIQGKRYCGNSIPVDIQSSDSLPNLNRTLKERSITSYFCGRDYNRQSELSPSFTGIYKRPIYSNWDPISTGFGPLVRSCSCSRLLLQRRQSE